MDSEGNTAYTGTMRIPKVKNYNEHYISYQNLFLYPELEKNFSLHISSKKFTRNL